MKQNSLSPDDPRLTAYALNELEPADRAEFEKLLREDPAARQAVDDIRATTALLATALEDEPMEAASRPATKPAGPGKVLRFPQFYYVVSGLAAACFALFFVFWQQPQPIHEQKKYSAVRLAPPERTADAEKANLANEGVAMNLPAVAAASETVALDKFNLQDAVGQVRAKATTDERERDHKSEAAQWAVGSMQRREVPVPSSTATFGGGMAAENRKARKESFRAADGASAANLLAAPGFNTEAYSYRKDNDYLRVVDQPLSTFGVDVDTASYANVRRFLLQGQRPPVDAVRIEELVNYFPYSYAGPETAVGRVPSPANEGETRGGGTPPTKKDSPPFAAHLEVASAPWAPGHRLVRIGLKGREVSDAARPAANLVFLLDVSGSMNQPNKLPLVKQSLRLLVEKLRPDDRVAIAVYAGASGLALPSTSAAKKTAILEAIDRLQAEGSTNGEAGIQLAYDIAKANFIPGGVNRVILATDGDFNVGVASEGDLVRLVGEKAKSGVFLTVLGFGMGNLKDSQLEQLADKGNGNYAYIDSLAEAKKSLVEQAGGTLLTIAKDVKLQVEFNPALVQAYRLIGYENRLLAKEDFNNDQVDAGEIGAGHTVTALYEIVPVGAALPGDTPAVDGLKYQRTGTPSSKVQTSNSAELLTVKIRYKEPAGDVSAKLEFTLHDDGKRFDEASQDFKFAAAVASFGMLLRDSPHKGAATLADVLAWGRAGLGSDPGGYRNEFITLVEHAVRLGE